MTWTTPASSSSYRSSITFAASRRLADKTSPAHEHPVVVPQVMHFKHVPFRTMVNWPQSPHGSPSYPLRRAISEAESALASATWPLPPLMGAMARALIAAVGMARVGVGAGAASGTAASLLPRESLLRSSSGTCER